MFLPPLTASSVGRLSFYAAHLSRCLCTLLKSLQEFLSFPLCLAFPCRFASRFPAFLRRSPLSGTLGTNTSSSLPKCLPFVHRQLTIHSLKGPTYLLYNLLVIFFIFFCRLECFATRAAFSFLRSYAFPLGHSSTQCRMKDCPASAALSSVIYNAYRINAALLTHVNHFY